MLPLLTSARTYITDALAAAKAGHTTHALVSAEAALHRLRTLLDLHPLPSNKTNTPST